MNTNAPREHPALDGIRASLQGTLIEKMGMELITLEPGYAVMTMPVDGNRQPVGLLHGGATIALAETVVSLAAVVHGIDVHGPGTGAVGTSFSATHHRSCREGTVRATARAQHLGRQVASYLVEVHDEHGTLLSTITGSAHLLPKRP